jgi:hypothetical protein
MRAHGTYEVTHRNETKGKMEGRARTLQEPVTPALWDKHLSGMRSLGIVPIDDNSNCHFGAIDIDIFDNLDLNKLEEQIRALKLPLIVCRTKSGGAHLYLFGAEPIPAKLIRARLQEFAIVLGHSGVEVFPKQVQLAGPDDVGNWINLPYFGKNKTDRYAVRGGNKLKALTFLSYADKMAVTVDQLKTVALPRIEFLEEAPPCIQHLATAGFPEGTRNNGMFSLGIYAKKALGDDWEQRLDELNQRFMTPPLTSREVRAVAVSLTKKNYSYKCKDEPLASCCNRSICVTRKFGIGGSNDPGVVFGGLTKIDTRPPTWVVDVDGVRVELKATADLLSQDRFRILAMEKLNRLPSKVQGKAWEEIIQTMLEKIEIIEAPDDAGPEGQFFTQLEAFCTDKAQARNREELVLGKPWKEEGRIFFRSSDFMKFLENSRFREITSSKEVWAILRKAGAKHRQFQIKRKCVRVWSVPETLFTELEGDLEVARVATEEF